MAQEGNGKPASNPRSGGVDGRKQPKQAGPPQPPRPKGPSRKEQAAAAAAIVAEQVRAKFPLLRLGLAQSLHVITKGVLQALQAA